MLGANLFSITNTISVMQHSSILGTLVLGRFYLFNWYICLSLAYVGFVYIGTLSILALGILGWNRIRSIVTASKISCLVELFSSIPLKRVSRNTVSPLYYNSPVFQSHKLLMPFLSNKDECNVVKIFEIKGQEYLF